MAAKERQILIDSPQLLSRRHRITDAFITGIMWVLYSYLWAPLISLIAWLLGFEFAYDVMVRAGGIETFKEVFWFYLVVVVSIFVVIGSWSTINRRRFANRERRKTIDPVSDQELAAYFGISNEQLRDLRSSRVSQVRLDGEGQIESVDAQVLIVDDGSIRPLGPQGGVTENETGDDSDENESLIQRSV